MKPPTLKTLAPDVLDTFRHSCQHNFPRRTPTTLACVATMAQARALRRLG